MCNETLGLTECDKLDGASIFVPWKLRLQLLTEEVDLWENLLKEILELTDPTQLAARQKKEDKVERILLIL